MKKIYWKVIAQGTRQSIIVKDIPARDMLSVYYPVGTWVEPKLKGSKLMVFSDKSDAEYFASGRCAWVVPCHVKHPVKQDRARAVSILADSESFLHYWKTYNENRKNLKRLFRLCGYNFLTTISTLPCEKQYRLASLPDTTVLCSAVYCLE